MKKIVKLILSLFILFLIFELISSIFKTKHEVTYEIKDKKTTYEINEIYKKDKYYFKITSKNEIYSFETENNFSKRKKVIKKIISYKNNDLYCIYPVLKNNNEKVNIICSKNKKTYSYEYYKNDLNAFTELLKEKGYKNNSWEKQSETSKRIGTLTAFQNNLEDNTYIYIYKYNGFYTISKNKLEQLNLFENDIYINHLGTNVGKYYVIPNYNQNYDYDELFRIDMTKNKVKTIKLKNEISKDSYINGIIENEIYLFDKDELKQYKINPKKKKIKEVGNKKDKVLNYNLGFEKINVYEMRDKEINFITIDDYINKLENTKDIKYIEKQKDTYYYQDNKNNIYYYNLNSKVKVLLLNMDISDFKLVNDNLYFISKNILYSYSNEKGLKKLLTYDELSFNSKNRIAIYME